MLFAVSALFVMGAARVYSDGSDHEGRVTLTLRSINALNQSGSPDSAHDKDCRARFINLIHQKVTTHYDIDTQTMIMSATSTFQDKPYDLHALGINGKYAFAAFRPSSDLPLNAVLFDISNKFTEPSSSLTLRLNDQIQCLLRSEHG